MTIETINPATGKVLGSYDETPASALPGIVARAHEAYLSWRQTSFAQRAASMRRAADMLRRNERDHARLMAEEMGKPIRGGIEEVRACAWLCDHFAEHSAQALANEFGLGACVLTRNVANRERIAADLLDSGLAYVNAVVGEDPRLPVGGIEDSGHGREMSACGIKEFVNIKTVCVA